MKKLIIIAVCIILVIAVVALGKDMIIKAAVEKGAEVVTGLKLNIASLKVGVLRTIVDIRSLKLFNPVGFKDALMIDMPQIYVDYDFPALLKGKVHLLKARLDLKEFIVVKNEKGELNLDSLKVVQAQKEGKKPEDKSSGKLPEIRIDSLELKIGKVVYKDYSGGGEPSVREFNVNLDEKYSNITDPYALASLIIVKALTNTTIANLTNFNLQGLQGTVGDVLKTAQNIATQVVGEAANVAKEAVQTTGEFVQVTTDTAKKAADSIKGIFKKIK